MTATPFDLTWQIAPRVTAQVLGRPFAQYRPTNSLAPIATPIATIPVWITRDTTLMASKPFDRSKPDEIYAALDPALTVIGDYLLGNVVLGGPNAMFFIASQDVPAPIRLVLCERIITITRTIGPQNAGMNTGYAGRVSQSVAAVNPGDAQNTILMSGWPAAIVQGTKGEAGPASTRLPGDTRMPWWMVMVPQLHGTVINMGDHITDDMKRDYTISSAELTDYGWRITALLASV